VANFWSLVVYDPQTRSELQTGQPFPSRNKLTPNSDGSIDLYFGPQSPDRTRLRRHHLKVHGRFRVTLARSPRRRTRWSYQPAPATTTTITLATTIRKIIGHRLTMTPRYRLNTSLPEKSSLDTVRQQVQEIIGRGQDSPSGRIPFTPQAKKVLELSLSESRALDHSYVGTEHILLGLLREGDGVAAQVLVKLGADLNRVRQQVIQMLGPPWP
jgi:hypothetical protein